MNYDKTQRAKRLLNCIGAIADTFLDEAKFTGETATNKSKKKILKYSAIGACAASVGIAATLLFLRPRRTATVTQNV
jgi:hypothetical protein